MEHPVSNARPSNLNSRVSSASGLPVRMSLLRPSNFGKPSFVQESCPDIMGEALGNQVSDDIERTLTHMATLSLSSIVELRATTASVALSFAGALLRPPVFGQTAVQGHSSEIVAAQVYRKSFPTEVINAFWSHSWQASHWQKVLVLLLFYNGVPAAVIGTLGAFLACGLAVLGYLPAMVWESSAVQSDKAAVYGFFVWSTISGCFFYLVTLFCWRSKKTIFLDKVCIHQTNERLRRNGIDNIGTYLSYSSNMLVLWDPTHVTRLWCVFELAEFLYAHRMESTVPVLCRPVIIGPTALTTLVVCTLEVVCILLLPTSTLGVFVSGSSFVLLTFLVRVLRLYHQSLSTLRSDFRMFTLERAGCFCCDETDHTIEGSLIVCDRRLVEGCIKHWFGSIESFNWTVQDQLFVIFEAQLGRAAFPYSTMLLALIPVLWAFTDLAGSYLVAGATDLAISQFFIGLTLWLGGLPSIFALISTVASTESVQESRGTVLDWLIAICGGAVCTLGVFFFSAACFLLTDIFGTVVGTAMYVLVVGLTALGFFYFLGRQKKATSLARESQEKRSAPSTPQVAGAGDDGAPTDDVDDSNVCEVAHGVVSLDCVNSDVYEVAHGVVSLDCMNVGDVIVGGIILDVA